MANTLTGLIPILYDALNIVSREQQGFIPAVARESTLERAAKDQTVRVQIAGEETLQDNTPGQNAADDGDTTDEYVDMKITKSKHYPIKYSGEETLGLGENYTDNQRQKFEQAFRKLSNAIESDIAGVYTDASRAYGTAGTTPFGTKDDFSDFAGIKQILEDNGAPESMLQFVGGSSAWFNLRGVQTGVLQKVNEAGSAAALREGLFGDVHGLALRNSSQIASHTAGAGSGYLVNNGAGYAVGDTTITVDTGTGEIKDGDVITFASHDDKYLVKTGRTGAGDIVIAEPGLQEAVADDEAITIVSDYVANMSFHRNAIQLGARLPALPEGGDSADDRMEITDPFSGLTFEVALYRQYRQLKIEIGLAWGWKLIKPEHTALLLG